MSVTEKRHSGVVRVVTLVIGCLLLWPQWSAAQTWPSLEQQLANDKVSPGSALEKLIRDSQDFSVLHPQEINDKLGLPPWLRVYWRKGHPEFQYSPDDPAGGYPRVLGNIYRWMISNPDLKPAPDEPPIKSKN